MNDQDKTVCGAQNAAEQAEEPQKAPEEGERRPGADTEALTKEIERQKEEIAKLKEEVARGRADYFNLRTRTERDRENNVKLASEQAVREMIPVFENLERISAAVEDRSGNLAKGMEMVIRQFSDGLMKLGLEFIPTEGPFDPSVHEAVCMEPVEDESRDGHITGALCRGYKLGGRVLKAPQVRVGKYNG